jgi:hypothetical protein
MKNTLIFFLSLILVLLLLLALLTAAAFIAFRFEVPRIEAAYPPSGQVVAVNDHRLHVYAQGERGDPAFVSMAGSSTTAPVYDSKGLYRRVLNDYRIVVVEWGGYVGAMDDIGRVSRDTEKVTHFKG